MTQETISPATTDDSADEPQPMLSPTATESEHWDAAFPDDEDADAEGATDDESEPGEDEGDDTGEQAGGDATSAPADAPGGAATGGRDYQSWIRSTLYDPTSIRNVPRGARPAVLAAVEATKAIAAEAVQGYLQQQGPALQQQMAETQRLVADLDELLDTDPVTFRRALHEASPEVRAEWYRQSEAGVAEVDSAADQRARAGASRRPVPEQRVAPEHEAILRTASEVNAAVALELGRVARTLGDETAGSVSDWIRTEGLAATAEDYEKLLAHTSKLRAGGRRPEIIDKRKRAPRADASPGISSTRGKRSPTELNEMSEAQLYSAWDD